MSEYGIKGSNWSGWRPPARSWLASFRSREEAWRYFTESERPGLRIEGDDWYGWQVTCEPTP